MGVILMRRLARGLLPDIGVFFAECIFCKVYFSKNYFSKVYFTTCHPNEDAGRRVATRHKGGNNNHLDQLEDFYTTFTFIIFR